jgi:hypothetical protein
MAIIMILNDGETYSDVSGCVIRNVPDNASPNEIEEVLKDIKLGALTPPGYEAVTQLT